MTRKIVSDPAIMMGKPTFEGTRITVEVVLRHLGQGMSIEAVLENYPALEAEDIHAALSYAAEYLAHERVIAAE